MLRKRQLILCLLAVVSCAGLSTHAQTIDDIRQDLRDSLRQAQFAGGLAGLIAASDELELSGATYWINSSADPKLSTIALPYRHTFHPCNEGWPGLYFEGAIGYASARENVDDIYDGALPGLETAVKSKTTTYGALLGLGPEFQLKERLTLAVIANGGIAHLENDSSYSGPGAPLTAALLDGLALNWKANTVSGGSAVRLDWIQDLGRECELELAARYDVRWTKTFDTTDVAEEFTTRMQVLTLRADVTGPTGWNIRENPVTWRSTLGYRYFAEGSLYDLRHLVLIGGGLEMDTNGILPLGPTTSLSVGLIAGPDVIGYTLGLGFSF